MFVTNVGVSRCQLLGGSTDLQQTHPIILPVLLKKLPPKHIFIRLVPFSEYAEIIRSECKRRSGIMSGGLCSPHGGVAGCYRWLPRRVGIPRCYTTMVRAAVNTVTRGRHVLSELMPM